MVVRASLLLMLMLLSTASCLNQEDKDPVQVKISTNYGPMVVELYDATPKHKANFLRLVDSSFYDSLWFHRIIEGFMIQGGDPNTRDTTARKSWGDGGPGYTLPAEFVDTLFHQRGALAAARKGDQINPEKRSSGSQFYIVQGKRFTQDELSRIDQRRMMMNQQTVFQEFLNDSANVAFKKEFKEAQKTNNQTQLQSLIASVEPQLKERLEMYKLSLEQRQLYMNVGGAPHLDGAYTVFGQLVEGWNVLDSIGLVPTNKKNQPLEPVIILKMEVL